MEEIMQTILFWSTVASLACMALLAVIAFVALVRRRTTSDARVVALYYLAACFWMVAWFAGGFLGGDLSLIAVLMVVQCAGDRQKVSSLSCINQIGAPKWSTTQSM